GPGPAPAAGRLPFGRRTAGEREGAGAGQPAPLAGPPALEDVSECLAEKPLLLQPPAAEEPAPRPDGEAALRSYHRGGRKTGKQSGEGIPALPRNTVRMAVDCRTSVP